ncbi:hypothetical protein EDB80DRAFT_659592 [Ilyonectria destructans]|nr:hypothetical protein EDB80DRAFT_659592 [Ilyonectria destructans]
MRKIGACTKCRRQKKPCQPSHHNENVWGDKCKQFYDPIIQSVPAITGASAPHHPDRPQSSEPGTHTPSPTCPHLEKTLSLPRVARLTTLNRDQYTSAEVLLLFWQDDEVPNVQSAVQELADVFNSYYHYTCRVRPIPSNATSRSRSSWAYIWRGFNAFVKDRDQRDVLKIVYYHGHTYLDGNREMILASSKDQERASMIRWGDIQRILQDACADTLIILDSVYYPSVEMVRQRGVLELISASVSDEHFSSCDRSAFTLALTEQLRTWAIRLDPHSIAELHSDGFARYSNPENEVDTTYPSTFYMKVGESTLPSIFLSPLHKSGPLRNRLSYTASLWFSMRLADDDQVDVDSFNRWLQLKPEGITVDGPFRTPPQ